MYTFLQVNTMARYILIIIISVIFLGMIGLPIVAAGQQPGESVFGGFLYNPLDGNSYLAKMRQGFNGGWEFKLPYTAEPGDGTYIFLFYLLLGHIARWMNGSLLSVYHAARVAAGCWLLWQLWLFVKESYGDDEKAVRRTFILATFGSGVGWLFFGSGNLMPDFLVPEIYPFLSAYTNPHFPLAMGLVLWVFRISLSGVFARRRGSFLLAGFIIATLLPFAWGVAIAVLTVRAVWTWFVERRITWHPVLWLGFGGAPVALYQISVAANHPVLRLWNQQNLTPSPPFWEVGLALMPSLLFAFSAIVIGRKNWKNNPALSLSAAWLLIGLVMMYVPFPLQRRFMFGIYIPAAVLAVTGLKIITGERNILKRWLWPTVLILSLPSNLLVLFLGGYGIQTQDPSLYLSAYEYEALMWVEQFTDPDALILASPEIGNYIPAQTGRRVLYGHPFETVYAADEEEIVLHFFVGTLTEVQANDLLETRGVDYIFYGPREKSLGNPPFGTLNFEAAYQNEQVSIYLVDSE
jgi:hypothetical protein